MAEREALTAEYVRQILHYDPETGEFRWKERTPEMFTHGERPAEWACRAWNSKHVGKVAGALGGDGYISISIFSTKIKAHRIACLYMTGEWPLDEVDHRDLDRTNNRWGNLRGASGEQNRVNRRYQSNNKVGFKGVSLCRETGRYRARIQYSGKDISIGRFNTPEEAHKAYANAARELHGEFARTE